GTSNVKIHSCPPLGVLLIASYYPNAALNAHLTTVTGTEYRSGTDIPLLAINRYALGLGYAASTSRHSSFHPHHGGREPRDAVWRWAQPKPALADGWALEVLSTGAVVPDRQ